MFNSHLPVWRIALTKDAHKAIHEKKNLAGDTNGLPAVTDVENTHKIFTSICSFTAGGAGGQGQDKTNPCYQNWVRIHVGE